MNEDDDIVAVLPEDDSASWPPLSPMPGDHESQMQNSRISIEQLPRGILVLVFNHLSWSDLASAVYTSDAFAEAAFDSAAVKSERPMNMPSVPVTVVLDEEDDEDVAISVESASIGGSTTFEHQSNKRGIEESGEEEEMQMEGQQVLHYTPNATLVTKRQRMDYERADTPVLAPSQSPAPTSLLKTMSNVAVSYQDNRSFSVQPQQRTHYPGPWRQMITAPSTPQIQYPAYNSTKAFAPLEYGFQHQQHVFAFRDVGDDYAFLEHGWSPQVQPAVWPMLQQQPGFEKIGWTGVWRDLQ